MTVETRRWTIQDHLTSPERQIGYLEAALEDGDPGLIAAAIGDIATARGMMQVAEDASLNSETMSKVFRPGGDPTLGSVLKVMKALGLQLRISTI